MLWISSQTNVYVNYFAGSDVKTIMLCDLGHYLNFIGYGDYFCSKITKTLDKISGL